MHMHAITRLITQGLLLSPMLTLAAPSNLANDPSARSMDIPLRRRQGRWEPYEGDSDGNLRVYVSEKQINMGSLDAVHAVAAVLPLCSENACNDVSNTRDTEIVNSNWFLATREVSIEATGRFRDDGPGTRYDMFALASIVMGAVEEKESRLWHDNIVLHDPEFGESKYPAEFRGHQETRHLPTS